jgi:hypothetical protein
MTSLPLIVHPHIPASETWQEFNATHSKFFFTNLFLISCKIKTASNALLLNFVIVLSLLGLCIANCFISLLIAIDFCGVLMLSDSKSVTSSSTQSRTHQDTGLFELKVPIKYCSGISSWFPQERHGALFIQQYPVTVLCCLQGRLSEGPSYGQA